jgi:RNA-binding protein NOB1
MSWASIAKTEPKAAAAANSSSGALTARAGLQLLVVDANAIIDGVKLEGIADRAVTIQEVLDEIKDKQSRQFLANLPYQLEVAEPTEDSIQAGVWIDSLSRRTYSGWFFWLWLGGTHMTPCQQPVCDARV